MKMNTQSHLQGKVAVITGAAHGIGKIIAKTFAQHGASIIISDINEEAGRELEKEFHNSGLNAFFFKTDLNSEQDIKALIEFTIEKFGKLDIIINNARPKLERLGFPENMKEWDLGINILLKAPALISKYALPYLKKTKGNIINISSTNAFSISPQPTAYHVAKAGLNQLTKYLAYELGPDIRVNAICPGLVDLYDGDKTSLTSKPINKKLIETIVPMKRAALAEEIAETAIFLSSDSANFITGELLIIDGGASLGDPFHIAHKSFNKAKEENE